MRDATMETRDLHVFILHVGVSPLCVSHIVGAGHGRDSRVVASADKVSIGFPSHVSVVLASSTIPQSHFSSNLNWISQACGRGSSGGWSGIMSGDCRSLAQVMRMKLAPS
jgi:hypothetical protein